MPIKWDLYNYIYSQFHGNWGFLDGYDDGLCTA